MFYKVIVLKYNLETKENEIITADVDCRLLGKELSFRQLEKRMAYMNKGCEFTVLGCQSEIWQFKPTRPRELFPEPSIAFNG